MKLLSQLAEMKQFTPNEQSIANYILAHQEKMLHLNIQQLAKATYTSHSAINRLTHKLGLTGFKEFSLSLAREFQESQHQLTEVDVNYPFSLGESSLQIAKEIADLMKNTIDKNLALIEDDLLSQTAQLLDQAERIFIYALGDSQIRAKSFQNKLFKINKYVVIATELSEWAHHTLNVTPRDCALFLTYHGNSPSYIKVSRYFQQEQIPCVTITANHQGELATSSTICIELPDDEVKLAKIGTFSSQIALEYILNVIYGCMYKIDYKHHMENAARSLRKFQNSDMIDDI
ncbi:MurR/RpiR family transcriptional regulator [Paenibacillus kyungheensis]